MKNMTTEDLYDTIGEEIESIAKRVKKLSPETEAEERAELAYDLRRCQQDLFMTGSFAPALAERVNEFLETTLMPILEEHLQNIFHQLYVSRITDAQVESIRRKLISDLRSEYEKPIRDQVALEADAIRERLRAEQVEAIRKELKEELRPIVAKELHEKLMKKILE